MRVAIPPCSDASESWLCLCCHGWYCSRYVQGHGLAHHLDSGHALFASMSDLSVWCHACAEYVDQDEVRPFKAMLHRLKFGGRE